VISVIYRDRVTMRAARGTRSGPPWGWDSAYGSAQPAGVPAGPAAPAPGTPGGKS
jgi:hypothetical protein